MARYSLLNHSIEFDGAGNAYPSNLGDATFTTAIGRCIAFKQTGLGAINGIWETPDDLSGKTLNIKVIWTANAITNTVDWNFYYKSISGDDTTSLDVNIITSPDQSFTDQTDGGSTARSRREKTIGTLTASNFGANRTILWSLRRDGDDVTNDTMAATALLLDVVLDAA